MAHTTRTAPSSALNFVSNRLSHMLRTASLVASRAAAHQHAHPALGAARGLAKKAKPSGKPASDATKAATAAASASDQVIGTNIMKDGQDAELRPDSEYPDWVWTLHQPLPSLETLMARQQADPDAMTMSERKRLYKLWNRGRIKEANSEKAK